MAAPCVASRGGNLEGHPMFHHPKFQQMKLYGFKDEEQLRLSLMVYLDLIESKGWWNVDVLPCRSLQKVLITGHASRIDPRELVLAQSTEEMFTMAGLQGILRQVQKEHDVKGLLLALVASDSTTLYSRITLGLVPPEPPEAQDEKLRRQKRKVRRRYQSFVRLAQLPENSPQYALTSASRRAQEHGDDPSKVVKMASSNDDKLNISDNRDSGETNDDEGDAVAKAMTSAANDEQGDSGNVESDFCKPGSSKEFQSGVS